MGNSAAVLQVQPAKNLQENKQAKKQTIKMTPLLQKKIPERRPVSMMVAEQMQQPKVEDYYHRKMSDVGSISSKKKIKSVKVSPHSVVHNSIPQLEQNIPKYDLRTHEENKELNKLMRIYDLG